MTQILQYLWVSSSHQVKKRDWLSCLLKTKGIQNGQWEKVVINTNYDHMTSRRNEAVIVMNISPLFCYECVYIQHL